MDLADAVSYHQLSLSAEGRSPATLRVYRIYETRFLEYLADQKIAPTLEALNPLNVRKALEWFRARPSAGNRGGQVATRTFLGTLKTWASFLEQEGIYTESPIRRVKRPRVPKLLREPFTSQEIMALWAASRQTHTPARDEALLLLLLDTGMRIGEACTLTLDKVQLDQRRVVVGLEGKGRRERIAPIGDPTKTDGGRTIRAIRAYLKVRERQVERNPERAGARVFLTATGGYPLTAGGGAAIFERLGKIAAVPNCIPHRARHTMATWYLTANPGDELGLRRIIGHVSKDVLADYVHLAQSTIAQRAARSSLVESMGTPKDVALERPDMRRRIPLDVQLGYAPAGSAPKPVEPPTRVRMSELLTGLSVDERRALLKALLADARGAA